MAELPRLPGYMRDLPALYVNTQEFRGTIETNATEVLQECMGCGAGRSKGAPYRLAHPDDAASIGDSSFKRYLMQRVSHPDVSTAVWTEGEPASSSAAASAAWVTRLCTRPLRRAASVACSLPSPYGIPITSVMPFS